jgi:hypothetical protein
MMTVLHLILLMLLTYLLFLVNLLRKLQVPCLCCQRYRHKFVHIAQTAAHR